jgi:hypothetical protein
MIEIRERPVCRKAILRMRLAPSLVDGVWDGKHAVHADGRRSLMSDGMRREMRRMIEEGVWGPITTSRRRE